MWEGRREGRDGVGILLRGGAPSRAIVGAEAGVCVNLTVRRQVGNQRNTGTYNKHFVIKKIRHAALLDKKHATWVSRKLGICG